MNNDVVIRNEHPTTPHTTHTTNPNSIKKLAAFTIRHFGYLFDQDRPPEESVATYIDKYYKGWYASTEMFLKSIILKGKNETRLKYWFNNLLDADREDKHQDMADRLIAGQNSRYLLLYDPYGPNTYYTVHGVYVFNRPRQH